MVGINKSTKVTVFFTHITVGKSKTHIRGAKYGVVRQSGIREKEIRANTVCGRGNDTGGIYGAERGTEDGEKLVGATDVFSGGTGT